MKHILPKALLGCLLLAACSKSGTFDDRSTEKPLAASLARTTTLEPEPAPIPADTLQLDSLRHPGTN